MAELHPEMNFMTICPVQDKAVAQKDWLDPLLEHNLDKNFNSHRVFLFYTVQLRESVEPINMINNNIGLINSQHELHNSIKLNIFEHMKPLIK